MYTLFQGRCQCFGFALALNRMLQSLFHPAPREKIKDDDNDGSDDKGNPRSNRGRLVRGWQPTIYFEVINAKDRECRRHRKPYNKAAVKQQPGNDDIDE